MNEKAFSNLCRRRHEKIIFYGERCPLCKALAEAEQLADQIEGLEEQVSILEEELKEDIWSM